MSRFTKRPIAAAAVLMFSGSAAGQQTHTLPEVKVTGTPDSGYKTESTSTALGVETPLRDIPQFMNIVPEPVIRQQGITSLQEALRNVPGITFTAAEGGVVRFADLLAAGLSRGRRSLPRRRARHRRVQPRPLQHRPHRSPEGSVGAGLRPRLDRRRHQPGHQESPTSCRAARPHCWSGPTASSARPPTRTSSSTRPRRSASSSWAKTADTYRDEIENDQIGFAPSFRFGIGTDLDVTLQYEYLQTKTKTDYGQPNLGADFGYSDAAGLAQAVLRLRELRLHELPHQHRDRHGQLAASSDTVERCAT